MALPAVVPRLRAFAQDGFGWLALLLALTYRNARILPPHHPYCNSANKGRFGIRHVIAEAANHLVFRRENIDQIIIFFAMLAGIVLLFAQFGLLMLMIVTKSAFAAPAPFAGMFNTPNATDDIALTLLAMVFGVPNFFCTQPSGACTAYEGTVSLPTPFHYGLQGLFQFYSLAILLVGVLILLYYVILMIGETAQTGTPFGRRFAHIYAPLRLVIAVGLLVPVNYGLNSAQYITLTAARMGSGFATNTWVLFNSTMTNATGLTDGSLIARTVAPDIQYLMNFMMLVQACRYAYEYNSSVAGTPQIIVEAYFVKPGASAPLSPSYSAASTFYNDGDITVRFGKLDTAQYDDQTGGVFPFCGEITVHRVDKTQPGVLQMGDTYLDLINQMWNNVQEQDFGRRAAVLYIGGGPIPCFTGSIPGPCTQLPNYAWKATREQFYQLQLESRVIAAWNNIRTSTTFAVPAALQARGWGGAGIWYNRIAQWNGAFIAAVKQMPSPSTLPWPMLQVQNQRRGEAANISDDDRFNPQINGHDIPFEKAYEFYAAVTLHHVYRYWNMDPAIEATDTKNHANKVINAISMIFGLDGLFRIRENHDVHPLAQMVAMGKGIVDAAVRNLVLAIGSSAIAGGLDGAFGDHVAGAAFGTISGILVTFTTIGLTVGFILYYVLPFLPFMYFFFAVGGWVKSIFEAMVGVPLWALAHLRVDGNGIPGDLAMNGYFLIFEIFIRPILTVFGLLASLAIFTAMARVLHEIFPLVTQNATGFSASDDTSVPVLLYVSMIGLGFEVKRDPIDEFFFTILYTIIVYLMATSSFKLIDQIPNNILRWMGAGVQSFSDRRDDPTQGLTQFAAIGGSQISGQMTGVLTSGARGAGELVGGTGRAVVGGISDLLPSFGVTSKMVGKP